MQTNGDPDKYDVAIIGGGPAGLSAAVVLGRACRRVILFDDGKPRNYAAQAVHCFLGLDGITPAELRDRGRREARTYGVEINDSKVNSAKRITADDDRLTFFEVVTDCQSITSRALLLATGVKDHLPDIPGVRELYGRAVHHCPYCDGWEHRQKHLVALAEGAAAAKPALSLRVWSKQVTACSNGHALPAAKRQLLAANGIRFREEKIERLVERQDSAVEVHFNSGTPIQCDAMFFSADQGQRSHLPESLGCEINDEGLVHEYDKQKTCVDGVFVAGDAAGDVQFAILAAAEGAIAAVAINHMLQKQEIH